MSLAEERLVSRDLLAPALPVDDATALLVGQSALSTIGEHEVGVWEAGPGTDTDVEVDEVFLILGGAGTVGFADGSSIELRPGTLVRLRAGDRTEWTITERLRKLYIG